MWASAFKTLRNHEMYLGTIVVTCFHLPLVKANEAVMRAYAFMVTLVTCPADRTVGIILRVCLFNMIACAVAYCTRSNIPPLQLPEQRHGETLPPASTTGVAHPPQPMGCPSSSDIIAADTVSETQNLPPPLSPPASPPDPIREVITLEPKEVPAAIGHRNEYEYVSTSRWTGTAGEG
ncbi:hypothetical protein BC835DRAFT_1308519 [Cytidiella melzeri]|nr:hypothetical protein BC835DRAFT_1308519 [Cytidiella melzeri]